MLFVSVNGNNEVLNCGKFYISFNQNPFGSGGIFSSDSGSETALCYDGKYKILNGDFRKQYLNAAPDFNKCLAIYESNRDEFDSSWSS